MNDDEFIRSITLSGEEWREVKDYEGLYLISNFGRIISLSRTIKAVNRDISYPIKLLTPSPNKTGYLYVTLCKNTIKRKRYIHRLVAIAFIPNPLNREEIDHLDGNCKNNIASNLRWCTRGENMLNPITRTRASNALLGSYNNATSKPVAQYKDEELIATYPSIAEACRKNPLFDQPCITRCCSGKHKAHRGYSWKFI